MTTLCAAKRVAWRHKSTEKDCPSVQLYDAFYPLLAHQRFEWVTASITPILIRSRQLFSVMSSDEHQHILDNSNLGKALRHQTEVPDMYFLS